VTFEPPGFSGQFKGHVCGQDNGPGNEAIIRASWLYECMMTDLHCGQLAALRSA